MLGALPALYHTTFMCQAKTPVASIDLGWQYVFQFSFVTWTNRKIFFLHNEVSPEICILLGYYAAYSGNSSLQRKPEMSPVWNFVFGATAPSGSRPPHSRGFWITHNGTSQLVGLLDEWSARRRDPYLTTHNTHNRQISMFPMGFEPTISAG